MGSGACGYLSFNSVKVRVGVEVSEISFGNGIQLMPNPNNGSFVLKGTLGAAADQEVAIEIADMLGQMVYNNKVVATNGVVDEQIILGNTLAKGFYLLTLRSGAESKVFRFVIGG